MEQRQNEKKKFKAMSSYYSREFHQQRSASEEMQIFRWFQLLQENYRIYNVSNYHDCIRCDREEKEQAHLNHSQPKPIIVQPFSSIDNFYGCVVCGKYHICQLKREGCPLVIDNHDKQKACAYSGKLLLLQDNLEAIFEDTNHAKKEALYFKSIPNANKKKKKKERRSPKKSQNIHIQDLFNKGISTTTSVVQENKKRARTDYSSTVRDVYDLSLESLSESEDDKNEAAQNTQEDEYEGENDDAFFFLEETDEEKKEREYRPLKKARYANDNEREMPDNIIKEKKKDDDNNDNEDNSENSEELFSDGDDDDDDEVSNDEESNHTGTLIDYDNENGDGDHSKNYHNNIRYNNEYYSFLLPVIAKEERKKRNQQEIRMDRYDQFVDLYRRDITEDTQCHTNKECNEKTQPTEELCLNNNFNEHLQLSKSVITKMTDEIRLIVNTLIKMDTTKRPKCKLRTTFIQEKLQVYYGSLVKNITLLVYQSPILDKIAMDRSNKNLNQTPKFGFKEIDLENIENIENDIDYHEHTLCPTKIVRALMLYLFMQPFPMTDSHGYRIDIWHRDRWLNSFNRDQTRHSLHQQNMCSNYYEYLSLNNPSSSSLLTDIQSFKKEIQESGTRILECLAFYKFCPLWLCSMIFL